MGQYYDMGQYYAIINLTKKQFILPHAFGDGAKLMEFGSGGYTLSALAILLANSNGRGGGDLGSRRPVVGSWAGDKIVIAGDYAEPGDAGEPKGGGNLYGRTGTEAYQNVSAEAFEALLDDLYTKGDLLRSVGEAGAYFSETFWETINKTAHAPEFVSVRKLTA